MRRIKRNKRSLNSEINVVPYIDVMLVLLIIFMVTAPLLTQGVKVDLPKAPAKNMSVEKIPPLILSVDKTGHYFLNIAQDPKSPETSDQIIQETQKALAQDPDRKVYVRADEQVNYGQVITAMVALQNAGAKSVGLITETPEKHEK